MAWILRAPTGRKPTYSTPEYFTIKLNHGGNLVKENAVEYYIDGTVNYFDYCDNDRISRTELQAMCKEVGYVEELSLYYKDNFSFVDLATHKPSTNEPPVASEPPATSEPPPTSGQNSQPTTRRRRQLNNDSDSESDSNCEVFIDSDYDLSEDDDALFNANVDTEIEWIGVGQKRVTRSDIPRDYLPEIDSKEGDSSDGFMSCDSGFDEDKEDKPKFRKYKPVVGKVQPIIEEDMVFKNRAQCVEAIRQHAIMNGKEIIFEKNDTDRVRAHCAAPYPWKILASSITKEDRITLQVKTSNLNHKHCGWVWTNKLLNSSWLARTYFKEFKIKPSWPVITRLAGIPCAHALAVFRESRKKVEGIVHHYYQKQTYVNTYKHVKYPMNGMDMWEKTDKPPIQPPHYTRKSGRPKKCRRREVDEPPLAEDGTKKMKRHLKKLSCRRCGGKGHNVRTCPSGLEAPRSKEKQCSQVITQPTFSQPSQPTPIVTRTPKAPARRGGATKGGAAPRGGAP
ncbi:hypothetical protein Vadar_011391 [Vaccinium darrowii]|uniref:Uncharacterized protein n=1 Tax=Vaccinium darrowii TaxID=229202 RepID=A0ACB7YM44_9ERIC|nr:hypothetical protein Vadar_011391 [Vaccinium darrowii]